LRPVIFDEGEVVYDLFGQEGEGYQWNWYAPPKVSPRRGAANVATLAEKIAARVREKIG